MVHVSYRFGGMLSAGYCDALCVARQDKRMMRSQLPQILSAFALSSSCGASALWPNGARCVYTVGILRGMITLKIFKSVHFELFMDMLLIIMSY